MNERQRKREKRMQLSFPGNKRVDVNWDAMTVHTDQRIRSGGDESAPQPFDLFFASIAACAGIGALEFCQENGFSSDQLGLELVAEFDPEARRYHHVRIEVTPPPGMSADMVEALLAETDDCTVKKHILQSPTFETVIKE